jgi:hypothetical protein
MNAVLKPKQHRSSRTSEYLGMSDEDSVPWNYYLNKYYSWNNRHCDTSSSAPLHKIDKYAYLKEELCDNKAGSIVNLESSMLAFI